MKQSQMKESQMKDKIKSHPYYRYLELVDEHFDAYPDPFLLAKLWAKLAGGDGISGWRDGVKDLWAINIETLETNPGVWKCRVSYDAGPEHCWSYPVESLNPTEGVVRCLVGLVLDLEKHEYVFTISQLKEFQQMYLNPPLYKGEENEQV